MDPRTTLIHAACWHLLLFSARPPQAEDICTATQRMLQNDVLENGIFKPRPKLAESSSRLAILAPSQLVGDGGAVDGRRSGRLQLAVGSYDHSERSEPEGVMPPFRYKGLESNFAFPEEGPSGKCGQMKWGGAPLRFPKRTRCLHVRNADF